MPRTREQLDTQDRERLQVRLDAARRAQIQELADNLGIPLYVGSDGHPRQRRQAPSDIEIRPTKREPTFDSYHPTVKPEGDAPSS